MFSLRIETKWPIMKYFISWSWPNFEYSTSLLSIQPYVDGSRRNPNMCWETCMETCRDIFVLIQQKLAEKIHPGRITITRGRIFIFFGLR